MTIFKTCCICFKYKNCQNYISAAKKVQIVQILMGPSKEFKNPYDSYPLLHDLRANICKGVYPYPNNHHTTPPTLLDVWPGREWKCGKCHFWHILKHSVWPWVIFFNRKGHKFLISQFLAFLKKKLSTGGP